jgi:pimeloyl-ACP methyl ester carboxylesterase
MNGNQSKFRRGFLFWLKRIMSGFLIFIVVAVATIFTGGAIVRAHTEANYPPPGQLVDVGDYKLHVYCQGQGSPTVIILAGSGIPSVYYWLIQNEASKTTRVCVYDRAGYAWSEEGRGDLSPLGQVEDLKVLFSNADIKPPYILAGHSYGGYIARLYAQSYPDEVAGLVMIDSAHEDQWTSYPQSIRESAEQMYSGPNKAFNVFLIRLLRSLQALLALENPMAAYFPPDVAKTLNAVQKLHPDILYTVKAEVTDMALGKSPRITDLGELPMVVITHVVPITLMGQSKEANAGFERVNLEMQSNLLSLSSNSKQIFAEQSNHDEIPVKQADLVVEAIQDVLAQAAAAK